MNWMCPYCKSEESYWLKDRYHCQDCGKTWEGVFLEEQDFGLHSHEIINGTNSEYVQIQGFKFDV